MESSGYIVEVGGYAGKSIFEKSDDEDCVVRCERQKYHILALTETCFSPSMWVHYANGFNGICIGYWRRGLFSRARRIQYTEKGIPAKSTNQIGVVDSVNLDQELYESFFYKHSDWSYEKEWRIVEKETGDKKVKYDSNDLACIIFGDRVGEQVKNSIINSLVDNVPCYKSKVGYRSFGINLLPNDHVTQHGGEIPPYIRSIDEFIKDLKKKSF